MEQLFLRVITLSLTSSAVLLPLLLLAPRLRHRYAARTCYFLWLLLAVRLLLPLPFTPPRPAVTVEAPRYEITLGAAAAPVQGEAEAPPQPQTGTADAPAPPQTPQAAAPGRTVRVTQVLGGVWLAGAGTFLLWQLVSYTAARRGLLRRGLPADGAAQAALERLRGALGLRRPVALRRVRGLPTPMMLGLLRPVVLLPGGALEEEALEVVLRHELCHLRRGDVAYKALLLLANAMHWFNPLAWWMGREAARNLELCCDDDVVRAGDAEFRRRYGEMLIHTAAVCRAPPLSTYFGGGKRQLKGRLANLFQAKKNSRAVVCAVLAVTLLAGSLVACESTRRVGEEEAMDLLEESIRYENGTLSFTIPRVETPSHPWVIHFAGRAEWADSTGMSLHYHTDTRWTPGQAYTEDLSQVSDGLTELFLDVTLGEHTRTVDLLPIIQAAAGLYVNETYGFTLQLPEDWAGRYDTAETAHGVEFYQKNHGNNSGTLFTLLIDDAEGFRAGYPGMSDREIEEGWPVQMLILGEGGGYIFYIVYVSDVSVDLSNEAVRAEYEAMDAQARALSADAFTYTGPSAGQGSVYTNDTYGFTLRLPEDWAGRFEAAEAEGLLTFYQTAARREDDPAAGVLMDLCVTTREDFDALYGDKDLDGIYAAGGPRITVLGQIGERLAYLHVDRLPEDTSALDQSYVRMQAEAQAITADAFTYTGPAAGQGSVYTNDTYGFTLRLPESWARYGAVGEDPDTGWVLFYSEALGMEQGTVASLVVTNAPREDASARMHYLGGREGCHVYLSFFQAMPRELMEGSEADKERFETLYADLADLSEGSAAFYRDTISLGTAALNNSMPDRAAEAAAQAWLDRQMEELPGVGYAYRYTAGRIDALEYVGEVNGYAAYLFEYRFQVDQTRAVQLVGGMDMDGEGWLRDYSLTAYLILRGGAFHDVVYQDVGPDQAAFWALGDTREEKEKTQAMAAYGFAAALDRLARGGAQVDETAPLTLTRLELEALDYTTQAERATFYPVTGPVTADGRNALLGQCYLVFSTDLALERYNGMLYGADAPYLFLEETLYLRAGAARTAPGCALDWDTFRVEERIDDGVGSGIVFTISGREGGAAGSWRFRLESSDREGHGYALRFWNWFEEVS